MKGLIPFTFTIIISSYISTANADNNLYFGALYNAQDISIQSRDFNTAGIVLGYKYNKYFSLETRFSTGTSGYSDLWGTRDDLPWESYSEDIGMQSSLFIKASYPVLDSFSIYGLFGYSNTKLDVTNSREIPDSDGDLIASHSYKDTEKYNGFSYGIGLDYKLNEQFSLFLDYNVLPKFKPTSLSSQSWTFGSSQDDISWKSTTLGINYLF